jgi:DNA-binding MarR family transcriptional regulator
MSNGRHAGAVGRPQRASGHPRPASKTSDPGAAVTPETFEAPFQWGMVYLLARLFYEVRDRTDVALKPHNLTPMQFTILASLGRWKGLNSAELSRRFSVTPQTMGEMIANLERRDLIARSEDPGNRRALRLELTSVGKRLVDACTAEMREMEKELFSPFSPPELADLRTHLVSLHEHLGLRGR